MITPEVIREKAAKLFEPAVQAWLSADDSFFPKRLHGADLGVAKSITQPELIQQVDRLRAGSKQQLGYGYTVVYSEVRKRLHGLNNYPTEIIFETSHDLFRLIGKSAEFRRLEACVSKLRERLPSLEDWLRRKNWKKLLAIADVLDDLILVTEHMQTHPRPGCYPRELPLPVSTKLVENHKSLLTEWWDRLLPEAAIDFGALNHFERRYGFNYPRQHLLIRVLDDSMHEQLGLPCAELSLPAEELQRILTTKLAVGGMRCRVVIVENKINLLTLPPIANALALGGMGNNLSEFQRISGLEQCDLEYWGDIDEAGLLILARMRRIFPHVCSRMMDCETLDTFRHLASEGMRSVSVEEPVELNEAELQVLRRCKQLGLRLEQERIPQTHVNQVFM